MCRMRHFSERAVSTIMVEMGKTCIKSLPALKAPHVLFGANVVARDIQVRPSIVVVVEKPRGKRVFFGRDPCTCRDIGEPPAGGVRFGRVDWSVVAQQPVFALTHRNIEVGASIVVEVSPGHAFHELLHTQSHALSHFSKGTVMIVVVQQRGLDVAFGRFVANKQVRPSIIVVVRPCSRLGRRGMQQACPFRHILKRPVAAITKERKRIIPISAPPATAQNENVRMAVIIKVAEHQVQAAKFTAQPCLGAPVAKRAIAVIVKQVHGVERPGR